jgi:hypothetical protein
LGRFAPFQRIEPERSFPAPTARVFVSTITPDTLGQEFFLRDLGSEMRARALEPVRMKLDSYDAKDPVGKIVETMKAGRVPDGGVTRRSRPRASAL